MEIKKNDLKIIILIALLYTVVGMLSNLASLRIIQFLTLSMDAGTLLYPLTFTLRDLLHKKAGKSMAIYTIILSTFANIGMFLLFYVVAILPADLAVGTQLEFGQVLLPGIRIVIASVVAMFISELTDTAIYSQIVKHFRDKYQWFRVLGSNAVSVPIDSVIFTVIAFAGTMPNSVVVAIILSNVIVKYGVTVLSVASIYAVKENSNENRDTAFVKPTIQAKAG